MALFLLRCQVLLLLTFPASAMTVALSLLPPTTATAGGFVTNLGPFSPLGVGLPSEIVALFQQDYPGFTYLNSADAASGTLTLSGISPFQNGLGGGMSIMASFQPGAGSHAPHAYEWMQYLVIDPLSLPFQGAASSPFTDPPPDARDDGLPFYWTNSQRNTPGLGYAAGGNISDDILFSDAPRVNDSRAPVNVEVFLYLADFDGSSNAVTIYDGVKYEFGIATLTAVPEPDSRSWMFLVLLVLGVLRLSGRRSYA